MRELTVHLVLGPRTTRTGVLVALVRAGGSFNRVVDRTARRHAAQPVEQLVAELRACVGSRALAPGRSCSTP